MLNSLVAQDVGQADVICTRAKHHWQEGPHQKVLRPEANHWNVQLKRRSWYKGAPSLRDCHQATHMHHGSDGLSTVSCMSAIALPDLWRVSCDDRATAVRHARVAFVLFLFLPEDFFRHACGNVQPGDVVTVDLASEQQASAKGSASSGPRGAPLTHSQGPCSPCTCDP